MFAALKGQYVGSQGTADTFLVVIIATEEIIALREPII